MAYEREYPLINGASNDTTATLDSLGFGWMLASLSSSADVDYFKVTTSGAALIKLELSNLLVTSTNYWNLALFDSNGDYVSRLTSSVSGVPVVSGSNTGSTLLVSGLTSAVSSGSRFSFATSAADTVLYTVTSAVSKSNNEWLLTLDQSLPAGLAADTALVFDPAQTLAAGGFTTMTAQVAAEGTYFVKVSAASWSGDDYLVRASVLPTIESKENDTKEVAIPFAWDYQTTDQNRPVENAWMTGNLSSATDVDCWVFSTASMTGNITIDFAAATGDNTVPEWEIRLTDWAGQPLTTTSNVPISATAGASKSFTIDVGKYSAAATYVIEVFKPSGLATVDTGAYTLRVSGATLDMNDTPVITIDSVMSALPYDFVDTGVSRSVKAAASNGAEAVAASKVALSSLFSASDADAGQTISSYNVALSKTSGDVVDSAITFIRSGSSTTVGLSQTISLTAAEMATAYLLPGTGTGELSLALQAFDSSGALDNSGASSVMGQTLRVVSSAVGVIASNDGLLSVVEGNGSSETLTFRLATAPTENVMVYLEQDSNNRFGFDHTVLTFTAGSSGNYTAAQTVVVTARDNQILEGAHSGQISFRVLSADSQYGGYSLAPLTFAIAEPANQAPTGGVSFTGIATENQILSALTSALADADTLGTLNYQWQRRVDDTTNWTNISSANAASYTLGKADVGNMIRVAVSYVDGRGTLETVSSGATASVVKFNFEPAGSVSITGTLTQGETLTAGNSLTDADGMGSVSYQWQAYGVDISGATGVTLILAEGQVGATISVVASYTDANGTAESVSSTATAAVANVNDPGVITISGTAAAGQTLTGTVTDPDGLSGASISYQWQAAGVAISDATSSTYRLTPAESGKAITLLSTYTDNHGTVEHLIGSAGKTVEFLASTWKASAPLDAVVVSGAGQSDITDASGNASFTAVSESNVTLTVTRPIPHSEVDAAASAVNLQDAIAILKMIVGLPVNGASQALSPYQSLAADFDGDGKVGLTDAIGVLKHVVGLTAPEPTWHFVNAADTSLATINPLIPEAPPVITIDLSGSSPVQVGLVGYLSGDVDGSFAR